MDWDPEIHGMLLPLEGAVFATREDRLSGSSVEYAGIEDRPKMLFGKEAWRPEGLLTLGSRSR